VSLPSFPQGEGDPLQEALKYVESLERRVVEIKGDGNCLFRALAFLVYGTEDVHIQMRELLADFISRNKVQFAKLTDKIDEHILKLKYQRVWGSALELQAIASLLQLPVYTLLPNREGTYKWVIYNPQDDTTLDFPLEPPPPRSISSLDHLELINVHSCHYNCIVDLLGHSPLTRPPLQPTVDHHPCVL